MLHQNFQRGLGDLLIILLLKMSIFLKLTSRCTLKPSSSFYSSICKYSTGVSTPSYLQYDKDPSPKFIDAETQKLLKSITRLRLDKIFKKRPSAENSVEYKFMTTEEIEDEIKKSLERAKYLLQMPPIVKIQQDDYKVLSKDPGLHLFDHHKYVFTDITIGIKDTERVIVVRQPDGTLENADAKTRKRINQIYSPLEGRTIRQPRMFEPEHLRKCLDVLEYEFVLDRMCIQYEPYEEEFHIISSTVYQHINDTKEFDILRSTRHFGPMSFFLAWHKMIDDLVIDMIKRDLLKNAVELICLTYKLNDIQYDNGILRQLEELTNANDLSKVNRFMIAKGGLRQDLEYKVGKSANEFQVDGICLEFINDFCKSHGIKKSQITLSLQLYRDDHEEKKRLLEGLQKAHGVS